MGVIVVGSVFLLATIEPDLEIVAFDLAMAVIGYMTRGKSGSGGGIGGGMLGGIFGQVVTGMLRR